MKFTIQKKFWCTNDTGHSFYEVHGFEFPAKTIFANNLKNDWLEGSLLCLPVNCHWLNFSGLKDVQNVPAKLIVFEIRPKKYLQTGAWAQISMDFVYWTTCMRFSNFLQESARFCQIQHPVDDCITPSEPYNSAQRQLLPSFLFGNEAFPNETFSKAPFPIFWTSKVGLNSFMTKLHTSTVS